MLNYNIMRLELGVNYVVLKTNGETIKFRFVGGEPPCGEVNGERISLIKIFEGGI